jgi:hypothetical protein
MVYPLSKASFEGMKSKLISDEIKNVNHEGHEVIPRKTADAGKTPGCGP